MTIAVATVVATAAAATTTLHPIHSRFRGRLNASSVCQAAAPSTLPSTVLPHDPSPVRKPHSEATECFPFVFHLTTSTTATVTVATAAVTAAVATVVIVATTTSNTITNAATVIGSVVAFISYSALRISPHFSTGYKQPESHQLLAHQTPRYIYICRIYRGCWSIGWLIRRIVFLSHNVKIIHVLCTLRAVS